MKRWYEQTAQEALGNLRTDPGTGLSGEEIAKRRDEAGRNEFDKQRKDGAWKTVLRQLGDVSTLILIFAAVLSLLLALRSGHGFLEPAVIMAIVVMNVILAVTQEGKAERALEALEDLNSPTCIVLRDGSQQEIDTAELVPGDIIVLRAGSLVPADARLLDSVSLSVDESALTGESVSAEKDAELVFEGKQALGDQSNMIFSGCLVASGHATAVVTATGMQTQMGRIAGYLNNTQKIKTPLQQRLDKVGKAISLIAVVSGVVIFSVGMLQGEDFWSMMLVAVSLAVAAVPETLSLIVTLSLVNGVNKMVQKNALIRKLPAVETLGSTSVICSDKTGTLTQNRMTVQWLWMVGGAPFKVSADFDEEQLQMLASLTMAGSATIECVDGEQVRILGDPTETAIMRLLDDKGVVKADMDARFPKAAEIPFSSARKMMTVALRDPDGGYIVLTKGAVDRLPIRYKADEHKAMEEVNETFAKDALRVIGLARGHVDKLPAKDKLETLEKDLELVGLIGIIDPPRPEAADAIKRAKRAGIRTVMITGDHAATAGAIAREIGILGEDQRVVTGAELEEMSDEELCENIREYSVYARVSPEDKIRIVEAWQENGEVVAMTGDGVNDAPALKAADVGVAMGKAGTEVAKSASDMVLTDDNFATIVDAVSEGRNVYSNIRKVIYFLLVCNFSEIVVMLFAQIAGWGLLLTPVMLLMINVIGDGVPGLQLAREQSDPLIMRRGPIGRSESLFGGGLMQAIGRQTAVSSIVGLVAFYAGAFVTMGGGPLPSHMLGQTMAFLVIGWTSILHIFTVRSRKSIFKRALFDNKPLVFSAVAMLVLFGLLVAFPAVGGIFGLTAIGPQHWAIAAVLSLVPTVVAELGKLLAALKDKRTYQKRLVRHDDRVYDDVA